MTVYLLHFEQPISPDHTTQHYVGTAKDLAERMKTHRTNPDARLLQVALERGIEFEVARTWPGGRLEERAIKNLKAGTRLCPICNPGTKLGSKYELPTSLDDLPELEF